VILGQQFRFCLVLAMLLVLVLHVSRLRLSGEEVPD